MVKHADVTKNVPPITIKNDFKSINASGLPCPDKTAMTTSPNAITIPKKVENCTLAHQTGQLSTFVFISTIIASLPHPPGILPKKSQHKKLRDSITKTSKTTLVWKGPYSVM